MSELGCGDLSCGGAVDCGGGGGLMPGCGAFGGGPGSGSRMESADAPVEHFTVA